MLCGQAFITCFFCKDADWSLLSGISSAVLQIHECFAHALGDSTHKSAHYLLLRLEVQGKEQALGVCYLFIFYF